MMKSEMYTLKPYLVQFVIVLFVLGTTSFIKSNAQSVTDERIRDIAWNADGTLLAVARNAGILEIQDARGITQSIFQVSNCDLTSVSWSPMDVNVLAYGALYGQAQILAVGQNTYQILHSLPTQQAYIGEVAWNATGQRLLTTGNTDSGVSSSSIFAIQIWDANNGTLVSRFEDGYTYFDTAWHPVDGDLLLISEVENNTPSRVFLWNAATLQIVWTFENVSDELTYDLAWHPNGTIFASSTSSPSELIIRVHDAATGLAQLTLPLTAIDSRTANLTWSPSVNLVVAGAKVEGMAAMGTIEVWNEALTAVVDTLVTADLISYMAWSPVGELTIASTGGDIEVDTNINGEILTPELAPQPR